VALARDRETGVQNKKSATAKQYPQFGDRAAWLVSTRNLKMARSAHAYVRGSTVKFYEWLESSHGRALPQGPAIWICGDCHSGNLGPLASSDGSIDVQIRDLDQTVIGNPAHDLIRLGLSLAMSVRGADLPGVTTARMLEALVEGYAAALAGRRRRVELPEPIERVMRSALRRRWRHLARERIDDVQPTIPLGKRFWPPTKNEREAIEGLFAVEDVQALVRQIGKRSDDAKVSVEDCAYWLKGCSSLGLLRFAVVVKVVDERRDKRSHCLLDIKEAVRAVAPAESTAEMPRDNAQRVVAGARQLSPHLGDRMIATRLLDRAVFVRELLPQDLKLDLDAMSRDDTVGVARYLAGVVGHAHARQMTAEQRKVWRSAVMAGRSKTLDAPGWLWSSVIELIGSHEVSYLEHCRRHVTAAVDAGADG
jgi:uncharacterized protein (DUF2252 family)